MTTISLKASAESALDRGLSVFPLKAKSKHPATEHGFKDASVLPAQIDKWWSENPNYNVGIACGESDLCVLDFDNGSLPEGFDFPFTYTVKTARGLHLYYWGARPTAKMYDANGKHIGEVKSIGGYVLGAGSVHPEGPTYTEQNDSSISNPPTELIERLTKKSSTESSSPVSLTGEKIPYGSHDMELTRIGGKLRNIGMGEEMIAEALKKACVDRCENYGSDYEEMCEKIAKSVCRYPVGQAVTVTIGGKEPGIAPQQITGIVQPQVQPSPLINDPMEWRSQLRTVDELEDGDVRMIIQGFMPEGTIFFGGLSGNGKTFVVLSVVKALTTDRPFVDTFGVNEQIPVIYLIPESSGRAFKGRLKKFGIPNDPKRFLCRTLSEGPTIGLTDPCLLQCVKELKPIVVLDTAIRFSTAQDENAAAQNKVLADAIVALRQAGAVCVIAVHHAPKASAGEKPSLENTLRGTGDFGAIADAVYNVTQDDLDGTLTMKITCVKPRDFEPPVPFRLLAKKRIDGKIISIIDTTGDFEMIDYGQEIEERNAALFQAINENPSISSEELGKRFNINRNKVMEVAKKVGWEKAFARAPWTLIGSAPQKPEEKKELSAAPADAQGSMYPSEDEE